MKQRHVASITTTTILLAKVFQTTIIKKKFSITCDKKIRILVYYKKKNGM